MFSGELGHLALLLAGALALAQGFLTLALPNHLGLWPLARRLTRAQFWLLLTALAALALAFHKNDFSLAYVAEHSNRLLPWYYRLAAVWGGHEGSLLLWVVLMAGWLLPVARLQPRDEEEQLFLTRALAVLALVQSGFIAFLVLTSNPFRRLYPSPFDGGDLNPMLQDIGLIFHPPLLYMGYVGFSLAFGFVVAGLWQGKLRRRQLALLRPWTLRAWIFLTLGIALGSHWAYYELGWGGWWFWDPVENASLMPWLVGAALIHALLVSEKRALFVSWTALLAIITFGLSLMGTFLVRSGILTSVHAFANDPQRGIFILALLAAVLLPALLLLMVRLPLLASRRTFSLLSKEFGLLLNNWLLLGACFVVLLGTLYPLLADLFGWGKVSVGAPYFNSLIVPLALLALLLLALGPLLRWQRDRPQRLKKLLPGLLLAAALLTGLGLWALGRFGWLLFITLFLSALALAALLLDYGTRFRRLGWAGYFLHLNQLGAYLAHLGFMVMALAIALTGLYSQEQDLVMKSGQRVSFAGYDIRLERFDEESGPNYRATVAKLLIYRDKRWHVLAPAKRSYFSSAMPMSESARLITPSHDLYLALGEKISDDRWALRLQFKPFISWIWLGALIMALGAGLSAWGARRKP